MRIAVIGVMWLLIVVGVSGVAILNRRRPSSEHAALWKKTGWYIVIVNAVVFAIGFGPGRIWPVLACAIVGAGLFELLFLHYSNPQRSLPVIALALPVYVLIGALFLLFAVTVWRDMQLLVYAGVAVFDGFSQVTGQLAGRRKLAPSISPAKTIEGAFGGFIMTMLAVVFLGRFAGWSTGESAGIGAGIAISALFGDLLVSLFKRTEGAKDFGRILPGQGGVLDRFNSFLAAGACWIVIAALSLDSGGTSGSALAVILFVAVLLAAEVVHGRGNVAVEWTRKAAHSAACLAVLAFPALGIRSWQAVILGVVFGLVIYSTKRLGFMRSIHATGRESVGSFFMPVSLALCCVIYAATGSVTLFRIPILILALADPAAAIIGKTWPVGPFVVRGSRKTLGPDRRRFS